MTGRDLVTASLRLIGAAAPGESLDATEADDALNALNRMISSWSTESLIIYTRTRESVAMTPSTATYTMGASGTYSSTRAQKIVHALVRDETVSPAAEYPVKILSLEEWAGITQKGATAEYPHSLYHDGGFTQDTVTVYPVPTVAHKLVLYSEKPLSSISTLDTSVSLPPGYEEALIYNLALRLAPEYGRAVPDPVVMVATESKGAIKKANIRPHYLKCDPALVGSGGAFDIYTGEG